MAMPITRSRRRSLHGGTQLLLRQVVGDDSAFFDPLAEVIVVDTETTGIEHGARLVEIAAIHVRRGVVLREYQSLIQPEMKIPTRVIGVHGITDAMVRHAPRADMVLPAFLSFVGTLPLVAHNAAFDRRIIAGELQRVGLASPGIPMYCTVKLAKHALPEAPNHQLGTLTRYLALKTTPTHRALADCHAALGVLRACRSRLHGPALTNALGTGQRL